MIENYFKTTFRNLWKTRGYSFLNIFGLAVGITAASLIFLWVEDEMTYDNLPGNENIYIVKSKQTFEGATNVFAASWASPIYGRLCRTVCSVKILCDKRRAGQYLQKVAGSPKGKAGAGKRKATGPTETGVLNFGVYPAIFSIAY